MRVHIDGNREYSSDELGEALAASEYSTVGEWADAIAKANTVGGSDGAHCAFSFKANGDVLDRSDAVDSLDDDAFLELIDVSEPVEVELVETGEVISTESTVDPDAVPEGSIDTVVTWVGGDPDRAVRALAAEAERGDGVRAGITAALEGLAGEAVPDGTIDEVLEWVGDDDDRRARALDAEQAKGDDARVTLVEALTPDSQ
jgi:hypothetical protein